MLSGILSNGLFHNMVFMTISNTIKMLQNLEMPFQRRKLYSIVCTAVVLSLFYCTLLIFSKACDVWRTLHLGFMIIL